MSHERTLQQLEQELQERDETICSLEREVKNLQKQKHLAHLAFTNEITGVPNTRALTAKMQRLRRRKRNLNLFVVYFDIDNFKSINDNYSHQTGDEAICEVAIAIQDVLREDELFHIHGDEFVAVFEVRTGNEVSDHTVARLITERMAQRVASGTWTTHQINLTISVGMTSGSVHDSVEDLLHPAETLMRQSKQLGRNQVSVDERV